MAVTPAPLRPEQVGAAQAIYNTYAGSWRRTDAALAALADAMPDFNAVAVLIKVVAVNSLYGTNVYALDRAAQHVGEVLDGVKLASVQPQLVEEMAAIPPPPGGKARRYRSFASKFAYFFIDHDCFSIYDSYAAKMLRAPLSPGAVPETGFTYMVFEAAFRALAQ